MNSSKLFIIINNLEPLKKPKKALKKFLPISFCILNKRLNDINWIDKK